MTAPQPSTPAEFWYQNDCVVMPEWFVDALCARDAALLAPLRAEVEEWKGQSDEWEKEWAKALARAVAAEAEVARLREALEQAHRYATGQAFRILTDALDEGGGNPSQKL